jgi:hypothetical protein
MWMRLILVPIILYLVPRILPRVLRTGYLVWKLAFDRRVSLFLKLMLPATLIYFLTPIFRIPMAGPLGYLVVLLFAVWLFINLSPQNVVAEYAPWRAKDGPTGNDHGQGPSGDPSKVVDGSYRVVDGTPDGEEQEPEK